MKSNKFIFLFFSFITCSSLLHAVLVEVDKNAIFRSPIYISGYTPPFKIFNLEINQGKTFNLPEKTVLFLIKYKDIKGNELVRKFPKGCLPERVTVKRTEDGFVNVFPLEGITKKRQGAFLAPKMFDNVQVEPGCLGVIRSFLRSNAKEKTD